MATVLGGYISTTCFRQSVCLRPPNWDTHSHCQYWADAPAPYRSPSTRHGKSCMAVRAWATPEPQPDCSVQSLPLRAGCRNSIFGAVIPLEPRSTSYEVLDRARQNHRKIKRRCVRFGERMLAAGGQSLSKTLVDVAVQALKISTAPTAPTSPTADCQFRKSSSQAQAFQVHAHFETASWN